MVRDARWDLREDGALHHSIAFEFAQGERGHPLGDADNPVLQGGEPLRAVAEDDDDEQAPLVADPVEGLPDDAAVLGVRLLRDQPTGPSLTDEASTTRRHPGLHTEVPFSLALAGQASGNCSPGSRVNRCLAQRSSVPGARLPRLDDTSEQPRSSCDAQELGPSRVRAELAPRFWSR